ncbi:cyclin-dependent protein kinase regulator [Coprinopsis cinerea okayama7|uniref:Cyclin-dependent protein kinase regulator n=1 Tax=Coprinopsis cinerea (strain Okayama-7 / 130 / ATCC MYA-4618 / FGSC 9003) TaxID=240176 RepID=A8N1V2_COPC7|nr:cyclin-dependent protein kinase regulator [Coprinopsis cinerea okayama7\|eukprot:XP_001828851.1 cyclin-dependent protein kinase regulator [Coprinopsis cinerea okayama7\
MAASAPEATATDAQPQQTASSSKTPLYEASTQYRNWRFSRESLAQMRASMNEAAVKAIRSKIEANEPGSSANTTFLTPDEEVLLVKLYVAQVIAAGNKVRAQQETVSTAMSYLKRFYLRNTVMDWHPRNVMLTCLFLATKTCNAPLSIEYFVQQFQKTEPSDVLDLEFLVAQSLSFEFSSLPDLTIDLQESVYNAAMAQVQASRFTDAEFIYTPSQIALASLALTLPDAAKAWFNSKQSEAHPIDWAVIEEIMNLITTEGRPPNIDTVREIDRRLKLCKNPEKVPGSKAYVAKKMLEEKRAEERRNRKAAEAQKAIEEDPFGSDVAKPRIALVDYDDDDDDDD